jgi:aminopeptidase N
MFRPCISTDRNFRKRKSLQSNSHQDNRAKAYKLKVNFDYQKEQMNGEEWLTASPYFYPTNELTLDAKAMLIHEVALDNNGKKSPLKYEYKMIY